MSSILIPQELIELANSVLFDKLINLGETSESRILKVEEIEGGFGYLLRFKLIGRHHCDVMILTPQHTRSRIISTNGEKIIILIGHQLKFLTWAPLQ